jgi:hypothetical protein
MPINSRIYQLKFTSMQWLENDWAAIKQETKRLLYFPSAIINSNKLLMQQSTTYTLA